MSNQRALLEEYRESQIGSNTYNEGGDGADLSDYSAATPV